MSVPVPGNQSAAMSAEQGDAHASTPAVSLWHSRDFLLMWSGQTVSVLGSEVTWLAVPLTAIVVLRASTLQVALLTTLPMAADALIALPAGVVADRLAKRKIMIWSNLVLMVIIGSIPAAAAARLLTIGQLYLVAALVGAGSVFFDVSYQGYLPELVGPARLLIDANGKLSTTQSVAQVAGPGLGASLVGLVGAALAMSADAISYLFASASLLAIRQRDTDPRPQAVSAGSMLSRLRGDIGAGLALVFRDPVLRKVVACSGTSNLFFSTLSALDILFLVRVLHVPAADSGLVYIFTALPGIAAGSLAGRLSKRIGPARLILLSTLIFSLPVFALPLAQPGWGVGLFVVGYGGSVFKAVLYNVAQTSYRQSVCPPDLIGRVSAAVRWITWGIMPFGGLLAGVLGTAFGLRATMWIGVTGIWAAGWWVFFSPLRHTRDVASLPPSPDHS